MSEPTTVVIGSSAGGSDAAVEILSALPTGTGIRILVVQHMLGSFTSRFADRLNAATEYEVREADFEDSVGIDEALVARGDLNMVAVGEYDGRLDVELTKKGLEKGSTDDLLPSVDVTMSSVADVVEGRAVGVVLSGMGHDGAVGVERLKEAGGVTVAQDEETSAVYGMPRRAAETGCVDHVLPRNEIADAVVDAAE